MGPGGPSGGATHPGGPHGLKWEGDQPLVGWCTPQGPSPAPRVGTLGWGGAPLALGGTPPPWPPPPWRLDLPRAGAPQGAYIKGGGRGQPHPCILAPPLSLLHLSLSRRRSAKPC